MRHDPPLELDALLSAPDERSLEVAWAQFVAKHSKLLLHVARSEVGSHDQVMDRYAYILERLAESGHRRLRSWTADRRSRFTTWLVVVAKHLMLDEHRQRYGRPRSDSEGAVDTRATRRRLADLLTEELFEDDIERSHDFVAGNPEIELRRLELASALDECLASLVASDRFLLVLRFRDGRSASDIARVLQLSSQWQVYRRLERVLAALRQALRARGVEDSTP